MSKASTVILPTDESALVATIDPDAYTAAAYTSDWVDMRLFGSVQAIIAAGALGSSATLDGKLQQATDSSGTGAKDISGKAITQLTDGGSDSDKQAVINTTSEDLDIANSFTHVAVVMTVGTATSDAAALIMGHSPKYLPASDNDAASVVEIV